MAKLSDNNKKSLMLGYVLVALGIGLIVIGLSWKHLVPPKTFWSEDEAATYAAIAEEAHAATLEEGHNHVPGHSHTHEETNLETPSDQISPREQFMLAREALIQAKSAYQQTGKYLSALGALVAFAGMLTLRWQA